MLDGSMRSLRIAASLFPLLLFAVPLHAAESAHPLTLSPFDVPAAASLPPPTTTNASTASAGSSRYGLFDLLDHRSVYGTFWFPEPLRADEADVDNELRLDAFHTEKKGHQFDSIHTEFEHAFGLLTLEVAGGYESDRSLTLNPDTGAFERDTEEGFTNIELGARYPFFQYVSPNNFFDDTFVLSLEVSPPSRSRISKDTEIVPKISNLLRLGEHFSLQTGVGVSTLIGPQDRGLSTLEYSAVFGYEFTRDTLPLPGVLSTTPILEFDGEYAFNHEAAGHNALFGIAGFHFDFESLPFLPAQPRLGIGYAFPIDNGARQNFRWGVVTSIIFEY